MAQIRSFIFLIIGWCSILPRPSSSAITSTKTGYDTLHGTDAICWESQIITSANIDDSTISSSVGSSIFNVEGLVNNSLSASRNDSYVMDILSSCPNGTWLQISAPQDLAPPAPLTNVEYNYTVQGTIYIASLPGLEIASDDPTKAKVLIETIACRVSSSFCSPFVDEQTEVALAGQLGASVELKDTHTNMGKLVLDLELSNSSIYTFNVQVPTLIEEDGLYNIIGVATFFVGSSSQPERRYDVANSLARERSNQYMVYSDPPIISKVEPQAYIIAYLLIGISAAILVTMITLTLKYYDSQVMQICQVPFLLTYQVAALMAVLSSILMEAKSDVYCNWSLPLIMIPVHVHNAITLGRLYRIHTVVSPLLSDHFTRASVQRFPIRLQMKVLSLCLHGKWQDGDDSKQIRRTIARLVIQPFELAFEYERDYSIGRPLCTAEILNQQENIHESLAVYSLIWLGFLGLTVLGMAYVSRGLPSILNESQAIFSSVIYSLLASLIIGIALYMTRTPDASPGLRFVMFVALVIVTVMVPTLRIVGPKLILAHAGMKIMLHQMISEHNNQHKPNAMRSSSRQSNHVHISGTSLTNPIGIPQSQGTQGNTTRAPTETLKEAHGDDETKESQSKNENSANSEDKSKRLGSLQAGMDGQNEQVLQDFESHVDEDSAVFIPAGNAPPNEILGKVVELQRRLDKITKRIAYGIAVPPEDWRLLSTLTGNLGSTLANAKFEEEEKCETNNA
ncbi:unnamed protein product [Cylindrotheca closterium]|uniref:G-protein coupled receptors family 3 profile domain-containing protein n=1 Tax=Cylindrotheca closterium TaxID=2856 RepID=A0AAD2FV67_9STRA|nr:unnamed protein product [Cylindrotheca closterium]